MLVPILQVFGGGLGMTQTARGYAEGVLLARSKLAELGVAKDLREGESSGEFEERGYRWHASIITDHSVVTLPDDSVVGPTSASPGSGPRRRPGMAGASSDTGSDTQSGSSLFGRSRSGFGSGSEQSSSLFGRSRSDSSSGSGASLFGRSRSDSSGSSDSAFGRSRSTFGSAAGRTSNTGLSSSASGSGRPQTGTSSGGDEGDVRDHAESIPYRVSVTVEWGNAWSGGGAVTLSTLRLKQAGEQGRNTPE